MTTRLFVSHFAIAHDAAEAARLTDDELLGVRISSRSVEIQVNVTGLARIARHFGVPRREIDFSTHKDYTHITFTHHDVKWVACEPSDQVTESQRLAFDTRCLEVTSAEPKSLCLT